MSSSKTRLIILIIAIAAVVSLLLYFFVWRPSVNDFQTAQKHAESMAAQQATLRSAISKIETSADITPDSISVLQKAASQFSSDLVALSKTSVVARDFQVSAVYAQHKDSLISYNESANSLVHSLQEYQAVLILCASGIADFSKYTTVKEFDAGTKDCNDSIKIAKSISYRPFGEQYLADYATAAGKLLDGYRKARQQADSQAATISFTDVTAAEKEIVALRQNKLNLLISPEPRDAITKLQDTIKSQKAAFLR